MKKTKPLNAFAALAAVVFIGWLVLTFQEDSADEIDLAALVVPELTPEQQGGHALFVANCAVCHGENAAGSEQGPPLVHRIYEPGHHSDTAFLLAASQGVRAHHWQFGSMPAVEGITEYEVRQITAYIRALQRANGIN